jgi:hypothetical protein
MLDEGLPDRRLQLRISRPDRLAVGGGQDPVRGVDRDVGDGAIELLEQRQRQVPPLGGGPLVQVRIAEMDERLPGHLAEEAVAAPGFLEPAVQRRAVEVQVARGVVVQLHACRLPALQHRVVPVHPVAVHEPGGEHPVPDEGIHHPVGGLGDGLAGVDGSDPGKVIDGDRHPTFEGGRLRYWGRLPCVGRLSRPLLSGTSGQQEETGEDGRHRQRGLQSEVHACRLGRKRTGAPRGDA